MRLLGDPDQGPQVLSPGIHSFPFKLGLPLGLPSTFLGRYGWVQFYCKAALREPSNLIHKNHQVFIVMNPIDLNLEQPVLAVRMNGLLTFFSNSRMNGISLIFMSFVILFEFFVCVLKKHCVLICRNHSKQTLSIASVSPALAAVLLNAASHLIVLHLCQVRKFSI